MASLYSTLSPLIPGPGCPLGPRGPSMPRSPCEGGQKSYCILTFEILDVLTGMAKQQRMPHISESKKVFPGYFEKSNTQTHKSILLLPTVK